MKPSFFRLTLFLLCLVATVIVPVSLLTKTAEAQTIYCKSSDYRYNFCRSRSRLYDAYVERKLSKSSCEKGISWGLRPDGIWVDKGCEAQFGVSYQPQWSDRPGYPSTGTYPQPPYPSPYPPSSVAVPNWLLGRWEARNGQFSINVYDNGKVRGDIYGRYDGYWDGRQIQSRRGDSIQVKRDAWGRPTLMMFVPGAGRVEFYRDNRW